MPAILLNPGPVNVTPAVKAAIAGPDLCHREAEWFDIQDEIRDRLLRINGLDPRAWTAILLAGSGTAAVEAMVARVPARGRGIVVVDNGVYGERIAQMAECYGLPLRRVKAAWTERPDLAAFERAVAETRDCDTVALVHHETTTGLLNDVAAAGRIARAHGKAFILDAVSSLAGEALDLAAANVDFAASTANKCIQGLPGMSFVLARRDALEHRAAEPPRSLYFDLVNTWRKQERRDTPFTPPVQVGMALLEALRELAAETVPARIARYAGYAAELRAGLEAMGLSLLLPPELRSNTITTVKLPPRTTYDRIHDHLKREGFVIYAGQGALRETHFRVANMGALPPGTMRRFLEALRGALA